MSQYLIVENFGKELKVMRKQANLTQEALSEKCGVSLPTIQKIEQEQEHNVEIGTIRKILDSFGFKQYEIQYAIKDKDRRLTDIIPKTKKRF